MIKHLSTMSFVIYNIAISKRYSIPSWLTLFLANYFTANCIVLDPLKNLNMENNIIYQIDYICSYIIPCIVLLLDLKNLKITDYNKITNYHKISIYSYIFHMFLIVQEYKITKINLINHKHLMIFIGHNIPSYLLRIQ